VNPKDAPREAIRASVAVVRWPVVEAHGSSPQPYPILNSRMVQAAQMARASGSEILNDSEQSSDVGFWVSEALVSLEPSHPAAVLALINRERRHPASGQRNRQRLDVARCNKVEVRVEVVNLVFQRRRGESPTIESSATPKLFAAMS
jgi:hypothetical protein